jgi:hypothetical protein
LNFECFRFRLSHPGVTELRTTALKAVGSFPSKDG